MVCPTCLKISNGTCAEQLSGQDGWMYDMLIDLVTPFGKRGGGDGSTIKTTEYRDLAMNDRSLVGSVRLVR